MHKAVVPAGAAFHGDDGVFLLENAVDKSLYGDAGDAGNGCGVGFRGVFAEVIFVSTAGRVKFGDDRLAESHLPGLADKAVLFVVIFQIFAQRLFRNVTVPRQRHELIVRPVKEHPVHVVPERGFEVAFDRIRRAGEERARPKDDQGDQKGTKEAQKGPEFFAKCLQNGKLLFLKNSEQ